MTNQMPEELVPSSSDKELDEFDEGRVFDSGYYWEDNNHSGVLLVSQKIVDENNLVESGDAEPIAELFDGYDWEEEDREEYKNYSHYIYLSHCACWSKTKETEQTTETPHGDVNSEAFVMWWNDLPLELLKEPEEDVYVFGWRDG